MLFDLETYLFTCQQRMLEQLEQALHALPAHSPRLLQAMSYACLQGGKRIRPILVYASARAVGAGEQASAADPLACAVELIHCYSLIHDDLPAMDDDDLRRGVPTVHKAFDEATAILAGDALQAMAFQLVATAPTLSVPAETRLQMLAILSMAAGYQGMVAGQAIDFAATGKDIDIQQLETMHSLKTGALIAASVQLGALCNPEVNATQLTALQTYANSIGLAFQVQDDILDVTSDTITLGKQQGADQALNKPTYVSLLGLEGAQRKAQELLAQAEASLGQFNADADALRHIARYIVARKS